MQSKAVEISAEKCIAKKIPVIIWIPKQNPSIEPKFQKCEMLDGAGKSIKEEFIMETSGCVFRKVICNF